MIRTGIGIMCGLLAMLCLLPTVYQALFGWHYWTSECVILGTGGPCTDLSLRNGRLSLWYWEYCGELTWEGGTITPEIPHPKAGFNVLGISYTELSGFGHPSFVSVSCLIPAGVFSVLAMIRLVPPLVWRRVRARRGHCRKCGYNLTGNVSGRCPECGEPGLAASARANHAQ